MDAAVDHRASAGDLRQLTFRYTHNAGGRVTVQINEYPSAISEGASELEARLNVLDALHDLTHEPTAAERIAFAAQACLENLLDGWVEIGRRLWNGAEEAVRELGRDHVRM